MHSLNNRKTAAADILCRNFENTAEIDRTLHTIHFAINSDRVFGSTLTRKLRQIGTTCAFGFARSLARSLAPRCSSQLVKSKRHQGLAFRLWCGCAKVNSMAAAALAA
jgi:hypothetical protein